MSDWFLPAGVDISKVVRELPLEGGFTMRDYEFSEQEDTDDGGLKWKIKGKLYYEGEPARFSEMMGVWGSCGDDEPS